MRLAALLFCLAFPAAAQTAEAAAQAAAQRLEQANILMAEARGARDRVKALTETVQAYEDGLAAMRDGMRDVAGRATEIEQTLGGKREELARLLGAISTISQTPRPVLMVHPDGPLGAARAGMMVAGIAPGLQAEVATLRTQLAEIERLRALQDSAAATLRDGLRGAQTARAALGLAVSRRTDLPIRFQEDPIQTALLQASAATLDSFTDELAASIPDVAPQQELTANGTLALPVRGIVLPDDGSGRPGVRIMADPRSLVTTPTAATVLFRGPLLDFGNVMILEPTKDVLFVISGLAEVFGRAGQILPAGAPIGLMGGEVADVDSILTETDAFDGREGQQTLYLEVRDGQSPVNPDAWFALE